VILEVSHVQHVFERFSRCPECGEGLKVEMRTVCITSMLSVTCTNEDCEFIGYSGDEECAKTTMHEGDKYERMTDYALNVLYVLGFVSIGDGHTEAGRILGLCGLPNDTTMNSRSFHMIEERIGPYIRELGEEIIRDNLIEEVRSSMLLAGNSDYFETWKSSLSDDTVVLDPKRLPWVDASYDMAWQQKGSGHQYNSASGHGSMFGCLTRRIIGLVVKSKMCGLCSAAKKKDPTVEFGQHEGWCWKNHHGTSGSMESAGCLQIIVLNFDKYQVYIRKLCCDDDSSICADCQWSNANYLINNNTEVLPMVPKMVGINKGKLQLRPDKVSFQVMSPNHSLLLIRTTDERVLLESSSSLIKRGWNRSLQ
jgi:hypothetical protein